MVQGGDFVRGDGTGVSSIYGERVSFQSQTSVSHCLPFLFRPLCFFFFSTSFFISASSFWMNSSSYSRDCGVLFQNSRYFLQFADENLTIRHDAAGLLSMANTGANTNGCQFFITCAPAQWLDGKHVVFGKVIEGLRIVRMVENVPVDGKSRPKLEVKIIECGEM